MVSGESHYFTGRRYRFRVLAANGPAKTVIKNNSTIELHVRPGAGIEARRKVLMNWYRQHLKTAIPPILEKWQKRLGIEASAFGIKR